MILNKRICFIFVLCSLVLCGCSKLGNSSDKEPINKQIESQNSVNQEQNKDNQETSQISEGQSGEDEVINTFQRVYNEPTFKVNKPIIYIDKSDRTLDFYNDNKLIGHFKIGLGGNPIGDKEKEGDSKTPVGEYYVCVKNSASKYYLSFGLNYPNIKDAENGLQKGVITTEVYRELINANNKGGKPNWYTPLGGEICIHGGGSERDWTAGCIALDNQDIDILWKYINIGTKVIIEE